MTKEQIIILVVSIVCVILLIALIAVVNHYKAKNKGKADNVKVIKGVRYTTNHVETNEQGDVVVTHSVGDVILERGETYTVAKGGKIIPGKYTVLSDKEGVSAFNLRIDDFVREYKHASDLVLSEGEKICAVSHSVILR